jgi:DNA-binding beta-propeller fold protein YncE
MNHAVVKNVNRATCALGIAIAAAITLSGERALAQTPDPNSAPNPYQMEANWTQLPADRKMGSAIAVEIDRDGKSVWVFDRCGAGDCGKSNVAPIMKLDPVGKLVTSFGAGLFNFPHGLGVDREGNVYAADERPKNGKGGTVVKFSPDGRVLLTLGKPGMPGDGPDMFHGASDVAVAANGDIYVADGHGGASNGRIVKFSKDGKFIKAWGKPGKAQSEFDQPHGIALDSAGRVYVGDRANGRIQIFDPDGNFVAEWKQFGRPSGVYIDRNDVMYVADTQSDQARNPGFKRGVRIGSVKDGKVTAFIPEPSAEIGTGEGVAADDQGNVFQGYNNKMAVRRFVKK